MKWRHPIAILRGSQDLYGGCPTCDRRKDEIFCSSVSKIRNQGIVSPNLLEILLLSCRFRVWKRLLNPARPFPHRPLHPLLLFLQNPRSSKVLRLISLENPQNPRSLCSFFAYRIPFPLLKIEPNVETSRPRLGLRKGKRKRRAWRGQNQTCWRDANWVSSNLIMQGHLNHWFCHRRMRPRSYRFFFSFLLQSIHDSSSSWIK